MFGVGNFFCESRYQAKTMFRVSTIFLNPDLRLNLCYVVIIWNPYLAVNDVHWTSSAYNRFLRTTDIPLLAISSNSALTCPVSWIKPLSCWAEKYKPLWSNRIIRTFLGVWKRRQKCKKTKLRLVLKFLGAYKAKNI